MGVPRPRFELSVLAARRAGAFRGLETCPLGHAHWTIDPCRRFRQFTFLPGRLKGLAGSFNYTWIDSHGLYTGATYLTSREVEGFIPYAANASLSWQYRKFSTRVLYNFTGEYINTFNATPALRLYRMSNKTVNVGVSYQLRP